MAKLNRFRQTEHVFVLARRYRLQTVDVYMLNDRSIAGGRSAHAEAILKRATLWCCAVATTR